MMALRSHQMVYKNQKLQSLLLIKRMKSFINMTQVINLHKAIII